MLIRHLHDDALNVIIAFLAISNPPFFYACLGEYVITNKLQPYVQFIYFGLNFFFQIPTAARSYDHHVATTLHGEVYVYADEVSRLQRNNL